MTTTRSFLKSMWLPAVAVALAGWSVYRAGASAVPPPPPPPPPPAVVGLVDMEALMKGLVELKARNTQLQGTIEKRQKELDTFGEKLKSMKAELDAMKPDSKERRDKYAEGIEIEAQAKSKQQILKRLTELDEGEIISSAYGKAMDVIARVAAKDGYTLVLLDDRKAELPKYASAQEMSEVIRKKQILYAANSVDITERVVTVMNEEYSAPAPRGSK